MQNPSTNILQTNLKTTPEKESDALQDLQNHYKIIEEKNKQLEKFSAGMEEKANKYAMVLSDVKDEKKVLFEKYISLQSELNETIK
ncbi:MAG: hypothetical protein AAF502_25260 [Bacteroidota bacterium]